MKMQISQAEALNSLRDFFSSSDKFISEAIQNARRAGATTLKIDVEQNTQDENRTDVRFTDDGSGFTEESWSNLLTVFKSGWEDAVKSEEYAYGVGFASLVFSAKRLLIRSNGKLWVVDTEDAINGTELGEPADDEGASMRGVEIQLVNVNLSAEAVKSVVSHIAQYSSVEIHFNGELLTQKYSFPNLLENDSYNHYETDVGTFFIDWNTFLGNNSASIYTILNLLVQEMPVSEYLHWKYGRRVILFANNTIKARLPDRDSLIDKEASMQRIADAYSDVVLRFLSKQVEAAALDNKKLTQLIERHLSLFCSHAPALLNSIDVFPTSSLVRIGQVDLSICDEEFSLTQEELELDDLGSYLHKDDLGKLLLFKEPDRDGDEALMRDYLFSIGACVLEDNIPDEHWLSMAEMKDLKLKPVINGASKDKVIMEERHSILHVDTLSIEAQCKSRKGQVHTLPTVDIDEATFIPFFSDWCDSEDKYVNHCAFIEAQKDAGLSVSESAVVIPERAFADGTSVVAQTIIDKTVSFFDPDTGYYSEDERTKDCDHLTATLSIYRGIDPAKALSGYIDNLPRSVKTLLSGNSFSLSFDEKGFLTVRTDSEAA